MLSDFKVFPFVNLVPDIKLLVFNQQQQDTLGVSKPSVSYVSTESPKITYTEHEIERMRQCGNLFDRRNVVNQEILEEFFRKESCLYSKKEN